MKKKNILKCVQLLVLRTRAIIAKHEQYNYCQEHHTFQKLYYGKLSQSTKIFPLSNYTPCKYRPDLIHNNRNATIEKNIKSHPRVCTKAYILNSSLEVVPLEEDRPRSITIINFKDYRLTEIVRAKTKDSKIYIKYACVGSGKPLELI